MCGSNTHLTASPGPGKGRTSPIWGRLLENRVEISDHRRALRLRRLPNKRCHSLLAYQLRHARHESCARVRESPSAPLPFPHAGFRIEGESTRLPSPRIVAIGGGTGLPAVLEGLCGHAAGKRRQHGHHHRSRHRDRRRWELGPPAARFRRAATRRHSELPRRARQHRFALSGSCCSTDSTQSTVLRVTRWVIFSSLRLRKSPEILARLSVD